MRGRFKLETRLLTFGIILSIVPLLIATGTSMILNGQMADIFNHEIENMAGADLDHIVKGVFAMCRAHQDVVQESVNHALTTAREVLNNAGGAHLGDDPVKWEIVNQYTHAKGNVQLPQFMVGDRWVQKNNSPSAPAVVVDKVREIAGATCTLFQRINQDGDMLRISTNVVKKDGNRAIGTYIPKINPDGTPNPVVSQVLNGKTFRGRAFVVDRWYITAYEPIYNQNRNVMGMLYVGIPQESVSSLREAILSTKVGQTGYIFVIDSKGNYVISKDGKRDGENILGITDAQHNYPIQEIINKAVGLAPGEIAEHVYLWQNNGDSAARSKIARIVHFKDWDWIIGASAYLDEFNRARNDVERVSRKNLILFWAIIIVAMLATILVWRLVARSIVQPIASSVKFAKALADGDFSQQLEWKQGKGANTGPRDEIGQLYTAFNHLVNHLGKTILEVKNGVNTLSDSSENLGSISEQVKQGAEQTSGLARTVTEASEKMSAKMHSVAAASEQVAGSVDIVTGSTEEMSATIHEIAQNTEKARTIASQAVSQSQDTSQQVDELGIAATEISEVTKVITDISEQTNLLALNATIEAARAGDAGKGFAVVANEIKDLANQTAAATLEIRNKIDGIQSRTKDTVVKTKNITTVIDEVNEIVTTIAAAVEEQATTTQGIATNVSQAGQGIQEVNSNIAQSTTVAENIAKEISAVNIAADEMATSGSQLNMSAMDLQELARRLRRNVARFKISGQ